MITEKDRANQWMPGTLPTGDIQIGVPDKWTLPSNGFSISFASSPIEIEREIVLSDTLEARLVLQIKKGK